MNLADLTYNEAGLIPCIVQDANTHEVLMMAWMNEEAVRRTLEEKTTWFWSRSRNKFWHKGEESGNTQELVDLRYDCDEDTLLALVNMGDTYEKNSILFLLSAPTFHDRLRRTK